MKLTVLTMAFAILLAMPVLALPSYTGGDNWTGGNSQQLFDGVYNDWRYIVNPYVVFDMGSSTIITSIGVHQLAIGGVYPETYGLVYGLYIQFSDDGVNYTTPVNFLMDNTNIIDGSISWAIANFSPIAARYCQVFIDSTGTYVRSDEILINGIDGAGNSATEPKYSYINLGFGEGLAINDHCWITGCRYTEANLEHPYVWKPSTGFQDLLIQGVGRDINNTGEVIGYGGGGGIFWSAISGEWQYFQAPNGAAHPLSNNNQGQIVGYDKDSLGYHSILWNNLDEPQTISDFGSASWAYDINDAGIVVGEAKDVFGHNFGYIWDQLNDPRPFMGVNIISCANAINDVGQIVGATYDINRGWKPFIWQDNQLNEFLGNTIGSASRINNSGTVVGHFQVTETLPVNIFHAFVWSQSEGLIDLTPGYPYNSYASGVNKYGYISGTIYDAEGKSHIALWKPIPEPIINFSISGYITLLDFKGDMTSVPITVELRKHGGTTTTTTVNLDSGGGFTINNVPTGEYDIAFKASHWLRKTLADINVSGNVANLAVSLTNGDVDGNNNIDKTDLDALKDADKKPKLPDWNPNADLNGDGRVNGQDMKIIRDNLGLVGDP